MEATAQPPRTTGPGRGTGTVGGHVHRLLALAAALTAAANHAAATAASSAVPAPLGVDLQALGDWELMGWAGELEQLNRHLQALLVHTAGAVAARVAEGRFAADGIKNPAELLATGLRLSRAEAYARLRLAKHFLPATDPLTQATSPAPLPVVGAAFFTGQLGAGAAQTAAGLAEEAHHLAQAGRSEEPQARELEAALTGHAATEAPDFLRRIGSRAIELLDPDGRQPTPGQLNAKQGIFFHAPRRGLIHFDGHLSIPHYETLMSTISWATNPKTTPTTPDTETASGGNQGGGDPEDSCTNDAGTDVNTDTAPSGGGTGRDDAGRDDATDTGTGTRRDDGPMPGQTSLWALIQTLRPDRQPPGQPAWPPEHGPAPDWAQPAPDNDDNSSGNDNAGDSCANHGDSESDDGAGRYVKHGGNDGVSATDHDSCDGCDSENAGDSCGNVSTNHGVSDNDNNHVRENANNSVSATDDGVRDHDNTGISDGVGRVGIFPPGESAPLDTDPACPADQWPRIVDGVSVPAPGQDRTLPGWTSSTRPPRMRRSLTGAPAPSNCSTGSWTACAWPPPPAPCRPPAG